MDTALSGFEVNATSDTQKSDRTLFQWVSDQNWSIIKPTDFCDRAPLLSEHDAANRRCLTGVAASRALEALKLKSVVHSTRRINRFIAPKRFTFDISLGEAYLQSSLSSSL